MARNPVCGAEGTEMNRHVAFLRGINLGNRRVKMAELRGHFRELDVENVSSFIASGNLIFDHPGSDLGALERVVEEHLEARLGFSTDVFIRSMAELDRLRRLERVERAREEGFTPHVLFLRGRVGSEVGEALEALEGPDDRFDARDREVIWFRRGRLGDSTIGTRDVEEAVKQDNTMRKLTTVERILQKFWP